MNHWLGLGNGSYETTYRYLLKNKGNSKLTKHHIVIGAKLGLQATIWAK